MKRILTFILSIYILLFFNACNKTNNSNSTESIMSSYNSNFESVSSNNTISSLSSNNTDDVNSENTDNSADESTESIIPVHIHSYTSKISKNATCITDGEKIFSCECGFTYTESISALGHKWGMWKLQTEPTTVSEGSLNRICSVCNKSESKSIPTLPSDSFNAISEDKINIIKEIFLKLVNEERVRLGLNPLVQNEYLNSVAIIRSSEIIELFSHTRPNGETCFTVIDNSVYPYVTAGENIIMTTHLGDGTGEYMGEWTGSDTDLEAVAFWMFKLFKESEGHYKNMINASFKECGYGISYTIDEESNTPLFYGAHIFGAR